jgi:predicted acylesterase/phospholipase RssA
VVLVSATKEGEQTLRPFLFRSYPAPGDEETEEEKLARKMYGGSYTGHGIALSQAMLATSAAPYYFPSINIGLLHPKSESLVLHTTHTATLAEPLFAEGQEFVDGGVVANDPTELAIFEAMRIWPGRRVVILSLGTGCPTATPDEPATSKRYHQPSAWPSLFPAIFSVRRIIEPLFDVIAAVVDSEATHRRVAQWAQTMRQKVTYERLNPPFPVRGMTACTDQALDEMIGATRAYISQYPEARLDAVLQLFAPK